MDKLERFFEDIHTIREVLEAQTRVDTKAQNTTADMAPMPNIPTVGQMPVQQTEVAVTPTVIPTAQESFTQEQIAVSMSNAIAAGRKDIIDKIFATFNAQCLMQINPANYNQIAVMLREAGIQV